MKDWSLVNTIALAHSAYPIRHMSRNKRLNSSSPGQNGRHFLDDIFNWIFVNEEFCIKIQISLKFIPNGPIDNNPALV